MAMSTSELLDVFKSMTVLELNDFLKSFEEEFGVTAAAPAAVAAAPQCAQHLTAGCQCCPSQYRLARSETFALGVYGEKMTRGVGDAAVQRDRRSCRRADESKVFYNGGVVQEKGTSTAILVLCINTKCSWVGYHRAHLSPSARGKKMRALRSKRSQQ